MKILDKMLKKIDCLDLGLIKLAIAAFVLFIITIWPAALGWVISVNPWYFLMVFVIFIIRPLYRIGIK
jgi:hypothetical protein